MAWNFWEAILQFDWWATCITTRKIVIQQKYYTYFEIACWSVSFVWSSDFPVSSGKSIFSLWQKQSNRRYKIAVRFEEFEVFLSKECLFKHILTLWCTKQKFQFYSLCMMLQLAFKALENLSELPKIRGYQMAQKWFWHQIKEVPNKC